METQIDNNSIPNSFQISLTQDQSIFIAQKMPKCYSLVSSIKPIKKNQGNTKIKHSKSYAEQEDKLSVNRTQNNIDSFNPQMKRQRTNKSVLSQQQDKIIPRSAYIFEQTIPPQMKACLKLLQQLKKHPSSWPFLEPVDPIKLGVPTYFQVVKEPIDLGTIGNNLRIRAYQTPIQFHADVSKMFYNSYRFNSKGSEVHILTKQLQEFYNKLVQQPDAVVVYPQNTLNPNKRHENLKKQTSKRQSQDDQSKPTKKKKPFQSSSIMPLTLAEKKQLGHNIRRLPRDCLKKVWQIVSEGNSNSEQLKFDIQKLSASKIRQLQIYVNQQLSVNVGTELAPKQSLQTSQTVKEYHQASQDSSSFTVSENSD